MGKVYQPIVVKRANDFINTLIRIKFFEEHEITSTEYSEKYLSEVLTEKFISGSDLHDEFEEIFTDEEGENILRNIVAGSTLYSLKSKGILDSYEDDETEEVFFLTDLGKQMRDNGAFD